MKNEKNLIKRYFNNSMDIRKIRGEASLRSFYRVKFKNYSIIAMLYPNNSEKEISKFLRMSKVYKEFGLNVADVFDVLDNRIIVVQDLGDNLLQSFLKKSNKNDILNILNRINSIILNLQKIDIKLTDNFLDLKRLNYEMDFFIKYFYFNIGVLTNNLYENKIKEELKKIVNKVCIVNKFSHRDFHTRNIIVFKNDLYLIDYQDSLRANKYYDYVSFIFDSYFDFSKYRDFFVELIKKSDYFDSKLFYLTALQRNIKALGTFGYQIYERGNMKYSKYFKRTLKNIINNNYVSEILKMYFTEVLNKIS